MKSDYDLIVIGGGGAGITAAMVASGLGKKVAMVDKGKFGGECTWSGCVPSKALIQSAKAAHIVGDLEKYGLSLSEGTILNSDRVLESVKSIVEKIYNGEKPDHFEALGINAFENAEVSFVDSCTVSLNGNNVKAKKFIIATGSSPMIPPVEGIEKVHFLANDTLFDLEKIPGSLVVLGGGPIGIEMASAFNRLGAKVTVIEMADSILFREDEELTDILHEKLTGEGISIITGAVVEKVEENKSVTIHYNMDGVRSSVNAHELFIAAGRKPNIEGLNLENAGVRYDKKGIAVNPGMRTSAKNIYAAGDVAGPYQFSHMANYQAIIAASNALLPIFKKTSYKHVPWITFSDPELARSGLTESEALALFGKKIRVFKAAYTEIDRGITDRSETGMAKVITAKRGQIVGINILGERAGEMMQELHLAKSMGIPLHKLNEVIHAYPAYSDIVKKLARDAYVDKIQNSLLIKIIKKIKGTK